MACGHFLGPAGEDLHAGVTGGQYGADALIGFDGRQMSDPLGQEARKDAGTGSDLEDIGRALGNEPVERFIRWA